MCTWKEGRLEIILVNYLIQVQISVGMLEIQMSVHIGRMEGDNPDFCGYVSTNMLFHIYVPSPLFMNCLCLNVTVSFLLQMTPLYLFS